METQIQIPSPWDTINTRNSAHNQQTKEVHSDETTVQKNTTPGRPLLLFKHNPKAAGGSILKVLNEIKPKSINDRIIEKLIKSTKNTREDFLTSFIAKGVHKKLYVKEELELITEFEQSRAFVISNIREPCSQYVSLWSYGSSIQGQFYFYLKKLKNTRSNIWTRKAYGQDGPLFDSERDIHAFRHVWLRDKDVKGVVAQRFASQFHVPTDVIDKYSAADNNNNDNEQHELVPKPSQVDCWVYVEDFIETFYNCLKQFENQGGYVKWDKPSLRELVMRREKKSSRRRLKTNEGKYKKDGLISTQSNHHSACSTYFDAESANLIENGPEKYLFKAFGYEGCCSTTYKQPQISPTSSISVAAAAKTETAVPATSRVTGSSSMDRENNDVDSIAKQDEILVEYEYTDLQLYDEELFEGKYKNLSFLLIFLYIGYVLTVKKFRRQKTTKYK